MPDRRDRFTLYSDTSKHATGSALYQVQDGSPKLSAYVSKRMPEAAKNYSITELEMCGLAINIAGFVHLLKRVDFDTVVDHIAITHIMRSKAELATNRIKRLLEILSSYSFNLYYIKGKDMVLSDFLSRQHGDDSNPHEIIPISFNMGKLLKQNCQNYTKDTFLVQTISLSKKKNVKVHDICSSTRSTGKIRKEIKPIIIDDTPTIIDLYTKTELDTQSQDGTMTKATNNLVRPGTEGTMYPNPIARPPTKPPELMDKTTGIRQNIDTNPNVDFEENSHHQGGIILETYITPDQSYPLTIKEVQAGYLNSLYFKDIYKIFGTK